MREQKDVNLVPRRYEVRHVTTYEYSEPVTASYARASLSPRTTREQRVLGNDVSIDPGPDVLREHDDIFGNHTHYVEIRTPHERLEVSKTAVVAVARQGTDLAALDRWRVADAVHQLVASGDATRAAAWALPGAAQARGLPGAAGAAAHREDDPALLAAWTMPSALVALTPAVRAYAADLLVPEAPLGTALAALVTRIHEDFAYRSGATTVWTPLDELMRIGAGVCQDFAHLAIGCLRGVGVPARYVSGYLETQPPPGRPKLQGSDATHAWLAARLPDGSWLELDPTNDCLADGRYVVNGWGRDYRDVAPLKGIIETEGTTRRLTVGVDVIRLD